MANAPLDLRILDEQLEQLNAFTRARCKRLEEDFERAFLHEVRAIGHFVEEYFSDGIDTVLEHYFDVLALNDHALGLCIADVSGHGMPAALLMSNLQAGVKLLAAHYTAPVALCEKLNQLVCNNVAAGNFITFFYGRIDTKTQSLIYVNAGHNQPMLLHRDGKIARLDKGGIPLGLVANRQYQQAGLRLDAGDRLVLFTDGLLECTNLKDEIFGQDRLLTLLVEHRQLGAAELQKLIIETVAEFCHNMYLDDLTLMVMAMAR